MNPAFIAAVSELIQELNANSASGLITLRALVLINIVQQHLSRIERQQ